MDGWIIALCTGAGTLIGAFWRELREFITMRHKHRLEAQRLQNEQRVEFDQRQLIELYKFIDLLKASNERWITVAENHQDVINKLYAENVDCHAAQAIMIAYVENVRKTCIRLGEDPGAMPEIRETQDRKETLFAIRQAAHSVKAVRAAADLITTQQPITPQAPATTPGGGPSESSSSKT